MANLVGGSVVWNFEAETKKFGAALSKAQSDVKKMAGNVDTHINTLGDKIKTGFGNMASFAFAWAKRMTKVGAVAAGAFAIFGLKTAGDLEAARQGFITLLGSAKEADATIAQIKIDAAKTPFELKGLIEANQMLTSVTGNGLRSEKMLLNVGKALAAMGKGQPELDRIIVNLQQIGAVGHASTLDLKQFAFAGIPIYKLLQDELGITKDKLTDMVEGGKITFELLEKLFAKAGGAGGKFEKAFSNQAGTFNQLVSNMKDSITIFASDFVKRIGLFDLAKKSIGGFTKALSDNKDSIINAINTGWDKFSNAVRMTARFIKNIVVTLNKLFGPSIKALLKSLLPLVRAIRDLYNALQPGLGKVLKILAAIFAVTLYAAIWLTINVVRLAIKIFTAIIRTIAAVVKWVGEHAVMAFKKARDIIGSVGKGVIKFLVDRFSDLVGIVKVVIKWIKKHQDGLKTIAEIITIIVLPAIVKLGIESIKAAIKMVVSGAGAGAGFIKSAALAAASWTIAGIKMTLAAIKATPGMILQGAKAGAGFVASAAVTILSWARAFLFLTINAIRTSAVMVASAVAAGVAWVIALGPITLAIIAIGLAALFVIKNWDKIKVWLSSFLGWVKKNWPTLLAVLTGPFGLAVLAIVKNWERIKNLFRGVKGFIGSVLSGVGNFIMKPFKSAFSWISDQIEKIKSAFKKLKDALNSIKNAPGKVGSAIGGAVKKAVPFLADGGIVTKPTLSMVGEAGAEAVIPLKKLDQMMGGNGQSVTINLNLSGVMARSRSDLRDVAKDMIEAVNEELRAKGHQQIGAGKI